MQSSPSCSLFIALVLHRARSPLRTLRHIHSPLRLLAISPSSLVTLDYSESIRFSR